jgi:integrase
MLAQLRAADGNPTVGPILRGNRIGAKPLNLDNLARRVIRPALSKAGIKWNGWYANRRGAGIIATALAKDNGLAAKGLLRHSNLSTTTQYYVKGVPAETQLAMEKVEQLFQDCSKANAVSSDSTSQVQ